jgi:AcrR family transcriptional regulator
MSSYSATSSAWLPIHAHVLQLEQEGLVTRTFRRLDPQRQEAILQAILDEAAAKGPSAVNIKQVAKRAGVSVGSLYTYFPSREGMLAFAVQVCVRLVTDELSQYRPLLASLPLRQALAAYLSGGIEWSRTFLGLLKLFARAAYHGDPELAEPLVHPIAALLRDMVGDILKAAADRGEIRADVDLEATTRLVHALTVAVGDSQLLPYLNNYFQVVGDDLPPERALEALVTLILEGIGTASGSGGAVAGSAEIPPDTS